MLCAEPGVMFVLPLPHIGCDTNVVAVVRTFEDITGPALRLAHQSFAHSGQSVIRRIGGEGGIRTHEPVSRLHAFQACSFNRSDTSPRGAPALSRRPNFGKDRKNQVYHPAADSPKARRSDAPYATWRSHSQIASAATFT